ncbi:serine/threonine protein kinase [Amycolatopsis mediterranei S699]|uniref:non-specific serine/threonine protein kinase n=1 Tax=Amycolatopsis mediterranei (strain S699) TaxID=713604 RepID=A0A9R0NW47_AMYMS|nr:serine/threonine protein kinase [Amycolatopsis mediterranei S699]
MPHTVRLHGGGFRADTEFVEFGLIRANSRNAPPPMADNGSEIPLLPTHTGRPSSAKKFIVSPTDAGVRVAFEEQLVNGRYRLLGHLGRGAMSLVWRAKDERLDRVVAVKQFLHEPGTGGDVCERAIREARLASRLRHPHAVAVYDVFEDAGSMYLVMEYVPARSLTELLVERGPLPRCDVLRLGRQIGAALAAAHGDWILHRDVTPNNVLVTDDGTARITDFGVSRALGEHPAADEGVVVGTLPYLAPEVARGGEAGLPSDVYSLGATLYTALEGRPPFGTSDDPITLLRRITENQLTPPVHGGPLTAVLLRMLERDPAARPSMQEAVDLLAAVGRPAPVPRRRSGLRRATVIGAAACLTSVSVVGGLALTDRPATTTAAPVEHLPTTITADHTVSSTTTAPAPVPARASEVPSRRSTPAAPPAAAGCTARYEVTNAWPGGAQAQVTVHNDRPTRLTGWTVTWVQPGGAGIRDLWNGTLSQAGSSVTVTDAGWNALVEPDGSASFGLNQDITDGRAVVPALDCRTQ